MRFLASRATARRRKTASVFKQVSAFKTLGRINNKFITLGYHGLGDVDEMLVYFLFLDPYFP
jgi:hypothetical protein